MDMFRTSSRSYALTEHHKYGSNLDIAFLTLVRYTYLSHNVGDRLKILSDRH